MKKYDLLIDPIKERYYNNENFNDCKKRYKVEAEKYCLSAVPVTQHIDETALVTIIDYNITAYGCLPFSVLVRPSDVKKAKELMTEALREFWQHQDFHGEVTGFYQEDIIRIFLSEADFPVSGYFIKEDKSRYTFDCIDHSVKGWLQANDMITARMESWQ